MHRDIKMANILLEEDASIKLCDFGLCILLEKDETDDSRCGSPISMAPEVILSLPYRNSPDWWSVGILIY